MKKILHKLSNISQKQWVLLVVAFKLLMFVYFSIQYYSYWEPERIIKIFAIETGDSFGYYSPAAELANGNGYENLCRMPGVVPLYTPVAAIIGEQNAKVWMVFCQLVLSIISILILAKWAQDIFKTKLVFELTLLLYTLSSFTSVFDHLMMADSLSISFFIFSLFFLNKGLHQSHWKYFLYAGIFLAWSVFLRQIMLVVYPLVGLLILVNFKESWKKMFWYGFTAIAPLVISVGLWSQHTLKVSGKRIFLAIPVEDCYSTYTKEYQEAAGLLIDMGYGEPFWTDGSLPQWFFRSDSSALIPQLPERHFDQSFSKETLISLRMKYRELSQLPEEKRQLAADRLTGYMKQLRVAYKQNHQLDYYLINKLRHARVFLMPLKLENFPGPSFKEMSIFQKGIKFFYLLMFSIVAPIGLFALLLLSRLHGWNERIWMLFPFAIFIALALVLGFVEQRYFAPIYPFCVVGVGAYLAHVFKKAGLSD
ncbi:MAG: glycosyltransferase family 39 protein [Flavobacteriales bacterium]